MTKLAILSIVVCACGTQDNFFEDVPPEPALTIEESAALPDITHAGARS